MLALLFEVEARAGARERNDIEARAGACERDHVTELRCAMPCARIEEVLPLSPLERMPFSPNDVAGLLPFRGSMVPVLDSGVLLTGVPSPRKLSTRLVVLAGARRLALICAGAHDVRALEPLPDGARGTALHALIARVMLAEGRAVHCLDLDVLSARALELHGEGKRESARTTA